MKNTEKHNANKATDTIQERLVSYTSDLTYDALSPAAIHAAKVRVIDTLGALIGGFFGEPCRIARHLAATMPNAHGATIIGTRMKTAPDLAAFVNATTARYMEMNDGYHRPGVMAGHPSDSVTPLISVAEFAKASGRDLISSVVLAYEIHLRTADAVRISAGFDYTNYICMATALAAGKLLKLSPAQLVHCVAMAVVPNNALAQARTGHLTMFKAVASGQAGRAGVFAALLAREGMEGPHLPFEGKAGWCDHVALKRYALDVMGGNGNPFKIMDTLIKPRSSGGTTIPSILAAENVQYRGHINNITQVIVETYQRAKDQLGTNEHHWHPDTHESADHSIPYIVAATLMDGTITQRAFDDAHLKNPDLRALLMRIEVTANPEFTALYEQVPVKHRTRVTVLTNDGQRLIGETGGEFGDLSDVNSDAQIAEKFHRLTEDRLGAKRVTALLDRLWHLEEMESMSEIPAALVLE